MRELPVLQNKSESERGNVRKRLIKLEEEEYQLYLYV
jgi:hypothetical protein